MTLISARDKLVLDVYSVGMQNSQVVLKNEDEESVVTDLEDLCNYSESNLSPAAINIENSSDVIIGPVTQFHGPVTIYQNVTQGTAGAVENGSANNYLNGIFILFVYLLRWCNFYESDNYSTK